MMTLPQWLAAYDESHRHPFNIAIHKLCVPLIVLSLLGMLIALPGPLPWAWLLWLGAVLWYWRLSRPVALVMAVLCSLALLLLTIAQSQGLPLGYASLLVFALAWAGQFAGHAREGRKPSFAQDLQFLLIGPLWTLRALWRRLGLLRND
ncbi:DUF962 domain-containing protein [Chromobacterium sphagni]|uniref:DUF962 domain-containing protein n=1 Tax=Chromobacterium sphagni TaxID=1903179 RepID=A0A1S1WYD5_9NEIS|nr:Mpo1-like protein [Chromobacterium sphagni]OHX12264.1 hypothetical protein BI347_01160 [Chromobacterium sphagni]OHX21652.1 hypothetical protein BI344_03850 [Chromobacterium sphagni]